MTTVINLLVWVVLPIALFLIGERVSTNRRKDRERREALAIANAAIAMHERMAKSMAEEKAREAEREAAAYETAMRIAAGPWDESAKR